MNKEAFLKVVNNIKEISDDDLENLLESSKFYPYCQNIHILIAKKYHDQKHGLAPAKLHKAAIYSPDRLFLKRIMEDDSSIKKFTRPAPAINEIEEVQELQSIDSINSPEEDIQVEISETTPEVKNIETSIESDAIQEIEASKIVEQNEGIDTITSEKEISQGSTSTLGNASVSADNEELENNENIHAELERNIREYKERRQQESQAKENFKENVEDVIIQEQEISEIPTSSESITTIEEVADTEVSEEKQTDHIPVKEELQKEDLTSIPEEENEVVTTAESPVDQRQLIENFIKLNPSLSRFDLKFDEDQRQLEDLSIPKLTIGEHLISENLAVILHKQGKVQKAINIYEKLILKFPEKKAYFASCIEKIKNPL